MDPSKLKELNSKLQYLLSKDFIRLSMSPWGAPVLLVKKKDSSMSMCIDYRHLNNMISGLFLGVVSLISLIFVIFVWRVFNLI